MKRKKAIETIERVRDELDWLLRSYAAKLGVIPKDMAHHTPHLSVVWMQDIEARVVMYYGKNIIEVQQPNRLGGAQYHNMAEYDDYEGNLREWVKHLRGKK